MLARIAPSASNYERDTLRILSISESSDATLFRKSVVKERA